MRKRILPHSITNFVSYLGNVVGILVLISIAADYLAWHGFEERSSVDPRNVQELMSAADEYWQLAHQGSGVQGFLLILKDGESIHARSYGYDQDDQDDQEVNENTQYYIASVSKQLTATLIYELQENGKLKVNDYVCQYIEHFCMGDLAQVKIEHLLTHTSGLPSVALSVQGVLTVIKSFFAPVSLDSLIKGQSQNTHLPDPGTTFRYSNYGYNVLSGVIAKVLNKNSSSGFSKAALELMTDQSSMNRTFVQNGFAPTQIETSGRYLFRIPFTNKVFRLPFGYLPLYGNAFGSGGFVSTPHELGTLSNKLMNGTLLSIESRLSLWQPRQKNYASGWVVDTNKTSSEKVIWHNGKITGFFSVIALYPDQKTAIIWLSNSHMTSRSDKRVLKEFDHLLFGEAYSVATERRLFPSLQFK